jgi:hypothetical protein
MVFRQARSHDADRGRLAAGPGATIHVHREARPSYEGAPDGGGAPGRAGLGPALGAG